jgi:hypothetical protein
LVVTDSRGPHFVSATRVGPFDVLFVSLPIAQPAELMDLQIEERTEERAALAGYLRTSSSRRRSSSRTRRCSSGSLAKTALALSHARFSMAG